MKYADAAARQIFDLETHYLSLSRPEAVEGLAAALRRAEQFIADTPNRGLSAPRPYPNLARPLRLWTKSGPYWVLYAPLDPPIIFGVFYETADIPGRMPR
jgi:plasmid stabilization system protein ParE